MQKPRRAQGRLQSQGSVEKDDDPSEATLREGEQVHEDDRAEAPPHQAAGDKEQGAKDKRGFHEEPRVKGPSLRAVVVERGHGLLYAFVASRAKKRGGSWPPLSSHQSLVSGESPPPHGSWDPRGRCRPDPRRTGTPSPRVSLQRLRREEVATRHSAAPSFQGAHQC